jgi:hypothetical protein
MERSDLEGLAEFEEPVAWGAKPTGISNSLPSG